MSAKFNNLLVLKERYCHTDSENVYIIWSLHCNYPKITVRSILYWHYFEQLERRNTLIITMNCYDAPITRKESISSTIRLSSSSVVTYVAHLSVG